MNRVYKWYLRMHNSNYAFIRRSIEVMLHIIFSCDIPPEVKIGKNCKFAHNALGVVLHPKVVIGDNCSIGQNVTIGGRAENDSSNDWQQRVNWSKCIDSWPCDNW